MLKADGFNEAFLGVCHRAGQPTVVAYDFDKCIAILCERDCMDFDEAVDFMFYNVIGAWVGDETPVFVKTMNSINDLTCEENGY